MNRKNGEKNNGKDMKANDNGINSIDHTETNDSDTSSSSLFTMTTNSVPKITKSYFCFDCGSVMTTNEDYEQHKIIEQQRVEGGNGTGNGDV